MRKLLVPALLAVVLATALAVPAFSARKNIEVDDDYFVRRGAPPTVKVTRNDKVVWEWEGSNPHNVTVTRGPVKFASRTKTSGTYAKRLRSRGTYKIGCTLHRLAGMRMTLKVR